MKGLFKIIFALMVAGLWFVLSDAEDAKWISFSFFWIIVFALFIKPFQKKELLFQEQYLNKLREGARKKHEISEQLTREQKMKVADKKETK